MVFKFKRSHFQNFQLQQFRCLATASTQSRRGAVLHRLAELRRRPDELERLKQSASCKAILFDQWLTPVVTPVASAKSQNVVGDVRGGGSVFSPLLVPWPELQPALGPDDCPVVFLGSDADNDKVVVEANYYFAVAASPRLLAWVKKSIAADALSPSRLQLMSATRLAQIWGPGRSLLAWHRYNRHCSACGGPTETADAGHKLVCHNTDCLVNQSGNSGWSDHPISHPRLDPSAIVLVTDGGGASHPRCLLARKAAFPRGMLSCLAGFAEAGESLEDCVRREVAEEVGLRVGRVEYRGSQAWPFPSQLMIGFEAATEGSPGDIRLDTEELEFADWFSPAQISDMLNRVGRWWVPPRAALASSLIVEWLKRANL